MPNNEWMGKDMEGKVNDSFEDRPAIPKFA
jgi:hypothetical protein